MVTVLADPGLETEISGMKTKDIREELESYGISTHSFFEKGDLVDALAKARREERIPVDARPAGAPDRTDRIRRELEKCLDLEVGELKQELTSYGEAANSFFDKDGMARAVAEARVDGPKTAAGEPAGAGATAAGDGATERPRDPSYRDVTATRFVAEEDLELQMGGGIIDVIAR